MRTAFLGSGPFALPALEVLHRRSDRYPLVLVATRQDRPVPRGRGLHPTEVRQKCLALGIECETPASVNDAAFLDRLRALRPDLIVTADFGEILRASILSLPRIGVFNLHGSLLPRHRGAAPVAHAILAGDKVSGVTLFRVERGVDTGPIVSQRSIEVDEEETAGELESRLAALAGEVLDGVLERFAEGTFTETPQDERSATLAPKLRKDAALIDWGRSARELAAWVHALNPWPLAYSHRLAEGGSAERTAFLRVRPCAVHGAEPGTPPGTVLAVRKESFDVACGTGRLEVLELQREGKAAMSAAAYLCGRRLQAGTQFGALPQGLDPSEARSSDASKDKRRGDAQQAPRD